MDYFLGSVHCNYHLLEMAIADCSVHGLPEQEIAIGDK